MRRLLNLFQILLVILLAAVLLMNVMTMIHGRDGDTPTLLGYSWAVVMSGSMEPTISVDDLVIAHAQKDYAVGDIIMYRHGSSLITHRIVEQTEVGYMTQGDANNTPDQQTVVGNEIVGKIVGIVPGVGLVIGYLRSPLGMMCVMMLGALAILLPIVFQRATEKTEE